jgi:hypothetical protein
LAKLKADMSDLGQCRDMALLLAHRPGELDWSDGYGIGPTDRKAQVHSPRAQRKQNEVPELAGSWRKLVFLQPYYCTPIEKPSRAASNWFRRTSSSPVEGSGRGTPNDPYAEALLSAVQLAELAAAPPQLRAAE